MRKWFLVAQSAVRAGGDGAGPRLTRCRNAAPQSCPCPNFFFLPWTMISLWRVGARALPLCAGLLRVGGLCVGARVHLHRDGGGVL